MTSSTDCVHLGPSVLNYMKWHPFQIVCILDHLCQPSVEQLTMGVTVLSQNVNVIDKDLYDAFVFMILLTNVATVLLALIAYALFISTVVFIMEWRVFPVHLSGDRQMCDELFTYGKHHFNISIMGSCDKRH